MEATPELGDTVSVDPLELIRARQWYRNGLARSAREGAGLSQVEFAQGLGITPGAVSRWEATGKGARVPQGRHAIAALRLLEAIVARQ